MGQVNLGKVAGENGITPHIGVNGNWWIGSTDTGVKARDTELFTGTDTGAANNNKTKKNIMRIGFSGNTLSIWAE